MSTAPEVIVFTARPDRAGGWVASAEGHSIVTEADTPEQLQREVLEAVLCHFDEPPRAIVLRILREIVIKVPSADSDQGD